jgi:GNAT superfamily N-acetyltransferase
MPQYRGKGIGKELFIQAPSDIILNKLHAYTASRNSIVIGFMKNNGFTFLPLRKLPPPISLLNSKFVISWYRLKEFVRKGMYRRALPGFEYGIK